MVVEEDDWMSDLQGVGEWRMEGEEEHRAPAENSLN